MQNHLPAIIFDFGGVLVDWDPLYLYRKLFDGDQAAARRFLDEIGFAEWNQHQDAGRPFAQAVAELSGRFPAYTDLIRAYDLRYRESISGPIWGSVEILRTLKDAGCALYGLSNWPLEKFIQVRDEFEFFSWFEGIILSGEVRLIKPDPRIFALALERIGRPAEDCLLIDDSERNIAVARQFGFQTLHFRSPEQLFAELRARGLIG